MTCTLRRISKIIGEGRGGAINYKTVIVAKYNDYTNTIDQ